MSYESLDVEVQALFDWNSAFILPLSDFYLKDGQKRLRFSYFYNQHISDKLTIKRVVQVHDLHRRIAQEASRTFQSRLDSGVHMDHTYGLLTSKAGRAGLCKPEAGSALKDVSRLQSIYADTTAEFCLAPASALALHPQYWCRFIKWSPDPIRWNWDVWDATLQVNPMADPEKTDMRASGMDADKQPLLGAVYHTIPDLASWEIPSLLEGNKGVMFALHLLSSAPSGGIDFAWEVASDIGSRTSPPQRASMPHIDTMDSSELVGMVTHAWNDPFKGPAEDALVANHQTRHTKAARAAAQRSLLAEAFSRGGSSLEQVEAMDDRFWRKASLQPSHSKDEQTATAKRLLEQAWADSVRLKTSIFVIHSGNFEFIGIRHRKTQTLYISDILHPPKMARPGYGQVQVGLYMLALNDAMHRAASLGDAGLGSDASTDIPQARDDDWGHRSQASHQTDLRRIEVVEPVDTSTTNSADPHVILREALRRKLVLAYFRFDIYDSPAPSVFLRGTPSGRQRSTTPRGVTSPSERLFLTLTSRIGGGATGVAHKGVMKIEVGSDVVAANVVAKLAFSPEQQKSLVAEYNAYQRMVQHKVAGIATCFGHFSDAKAGGPSCLLLDYVGRTVKQRDILLSLAERNAFIDILSGIHRVGVLHGDVARDHNLLFDDHNQPKIIDFGHSSHGAEESDYAYELEMFKEYLDQHLTLAAHQELRAASLARASESVDSSPPPAKRSRGLDHAGRAANKPNARRGGKRKGRRR